MSFQTHITYAEYFFMNILASLFIMTTIGPDLNYSEDI